MQTAKKRWIKKHNLSEKNIYFVVAYYLLMWSDVTSIEELLLRKDNKLTN